MSATAYTLPIELDTLAATKAAERGMTPQQFVEAAVRKVAELSDPWDLFADVRAEVAARGISEDELEAEINAAIQEVRTRQ